MLFTIIQVIYDAITDLAQEYRNMMLSLSYSILKDYQYAEDITQEALLILSRNMDKMDNIYSSRSKNYVYTITKNLAISMYRSLKNENTVQSDKDNSLSNIEGYLDIEAFGNEYGFSEEIMNALAKLDELDRDILCYKYGAGYTGREIAKLTNSNPDFIYKRMQRAISKLRKIIEDMERTEKNE